MILSQEIVINKLDITIQPLRNDWDQRRVMCLLVLYSARGRFSPYTTFLVQRASLFVCSLPNQENSFAKT